MKQMAASMIWICVSSRTNCMFHILQKVGEERKVSKLHNVYLMDDVVESDQWKLPAAHGIILILILITQLHWNPYLNDHRLNSSSLNKFHTLMSTIVKLQQNIWAQIFPHVKSEFHFSRPTYSLAYRMRRIHNSISMNGRATGEGDILGTRCHLFMCTWADCSIHHHAMKKLHPFIILTVWWIYCKFLCNRSDRVTSSCMALVLKLTVLYHSYSNNTSQYHQPSLHLLLPVMAFLALFQVSPILSPACTHETQVTHLNHTLTATLSSPAPLWTTVTL